MKITPIKTSIVEPFTDLEAWLTESLVDIEIKERSVLAVTSKVVGLCEGRVVKKITGETAEKHALVRDEAEWYLEPHSTKFNLMFTVKQGVLAVNAGIDESNVNQEYYSLLPEDSFQAAERIWQWLRQTKGVNHVGVIVTDSRTIPLKWGVLGTALGYCGFVGLQSFIGKPDIYGRPMQMTQVNNAEALAVVATYVSGESNEQQPLVLITEVSQLQFVDHSPDQDERAILSIDQEDDMYWPLLSKVDWQKGGGKR